MSLQLSNFDQTGHDPDALGLFVAAAPPSIYMDAARGGTQSLEDGEFGLGGDQTRISLVRVLSNNRLALGDSDQPAELSLIDWFGSSGTSDWTVHVQTDDGVVSSNQVDSSGANIVRFSFGAFGVLNQIASGDRVIVAVTRPTLPLAASLAGAAGSITAALGKRAAGTLQVAASLAGAAGSITAALGKQAAGTLQVAASLAGAAGSITAALGKQAGPTLPLAASLAGAGGSITAALGKQAPGALSVAASLAGAAGSVTAALGKQTGATHQVAANLAGANGSITAALGKQAPGTLSVAASLAGAGGSITAALGRQTLATLPVAASLAGVGGSFTAALARRAPDQPSAVLVASQASVERGRSVELRWAVANALSVEIDRGIGAVPAAGTMRVAPEASTTWTLTASAYGLQAVASVTVSVTPRAPFGAVSLLPPNATGFERALEAALAQDVDIPIRKLWSSADCPVDMLPWLAWSLGVEEWDPDWPEPVKRAAVSNAIAVHREKGTLAGLKRVLDTAGAEYEYVERPAGVPMTARLSILNSNAVYLPDVARAVNRVKRASLDLDIELLSAAAGRIPVAAGLGAATVVEISDWGGYTV